MRKYAVLLILLAGCKSKLEKCNAVCEKLDKEHQAECRDESCRATLAETLRSCQSICRMAVGEKPSATSDQKACDQGDAHACEELAEMYALGRGGATKDDAKAVVLFEKSCNLGNAVSCEFRGKMAREGRGISANQAEAFRWLEKGCAGGAAGACTSLGLDAFKTDKRRGVELLQKACDGHDKLGCMGLAGLYLHGNGVRRDKARAKDLLKKSCDYGAKPACDKLASL
jgi:TPR repeat protein